MMAKHLASVYRTGRRSAAWQKIKPRLLVPCVIVGWRKDRKGFMRALLVAAERQGRLQYVATLEGGGSAVEAAQVQALLPGRERSGLVVDGPAGGAPLRAGVYFQVTLLGWM